MDYFQARELLRHAGTRQIMPRKKVANNTYVRGEAPAGKDYAPTALGSDVVLRLHATDIIRFRYDGTVTFDSGGWLTVTTKQRMNEYGAPFRFHADRGQWRVSALEHAPYYENPDGTRVTDWRDAQEGNTYVTGSFFTVPYRDGITLEPAHPLESLQRELETPEAREARELLERDKVMKRRIAAYARGITGPMLRELLERAQAEGIGGDCWFCSMFDRAADSSSSSDHLLSHLEESYYMVSLFRNALEECGYRDPVFILNIESRDARHAPTSTRKAVRRYLEARLLVGATSGRRGSAVVSNHWGG